MHQAGRVPLCSLIFSSLSFLPLPQTRGGGQGVAQNQDLFFYLSALAVTCGKEILLVPAMSKVAATSRNVMVHSKVPVFFLQ